MNRNEVYRLIDGERNYQDGVYGNNAHSPAEWLLFIDNYIAEAKNIVTRESKHIAPASRMMNVFRKIAAISVAAMEQHDTPPRTL